MIDSIVADLGPWNWIVLGFVLVVMEMVAPGVFLLWIGIAALIVLVVGWLVLPWIT